MIPILRATGHVPAVVRRILLPPHRRSEQFRAACRVVHRIERKALRLAGPPDQAITCTAANKRLGLERFRLEKRPYIEPFQIERELRELEPSYAELTAAIAGSVSCGGKQRKREMTVWLVLWFIGSTTPIHVGNFTSLEACDTAAKRAVFIPGPHSNSLPQAFNLVCIQASESGTTAPN